MRIYGGSERDADAMDAFPEFRLASQDTSCWCLDVKQATVLLGEGIDCQFDKYPLADVAVGDIVYAEAHIYRRDILSPRSTQKWKRYNTCFEITSIVLLM